VDSTIDQLALKEELSLDSALDSAKRQVVQMSEAATNPSAPIVESELAIAVQHLAFDFFYFRLYSGLNRDFGFGISNPAASQAVTYALLLHFRVILDFFYTAQPKKDDCCVTHFLQLSPAFKANFPALARPTWLKEVRDNLHKRLAHMTATRWRERQPDMDYYRKYFGDIDDLTETFLKALPADLRTAFDSEWNRFERENRTALSKPPGQFRVQP
jgi:hypothetical protein